MTIVRKSLKEDTAVKVHNPRSFKSLKSDGEKLNTAIVKPDAKNKHQNADIEQAKLTLLQRVIAKIGIAVTEAINAEKDTLIVRNVCYALMGTLTSDLLRVFKLSKGVSTAQVKIATNLAKKVHSVIL